ncbi:30S ribosomal protein S6 [bacterium]|nr:30S ribosomal protein S6 [bacterium]
MKKYEIVFVLHADEPESEMAERVQKVESFVAGAGGEITERNHWGERQLAYPIEHETRGNYMHLRFRCDGTAIDKMDNEFRLDHRVLRHLVVVDEEWKERNEANRAKRRAARAAAITAASAASAAPAPEAAPAGDKS